MVKISAECGYDINKEKEISRIRFDIISNNGIVKEIFFLSFSDPIENQEAINLFSSVVKELIERTK